MLKLIIFALIIPLFGFVVYLMNKSYSRSLDAKREELKEEVVRTEILNTEEEIAGIRQQNDAREQTIATTGAKQ